jgi:hypothetical protein
VWRKLKQFYDLLWFTESRFTSFMRLHMERNINHSSVRVRTHVRFVSPCVLYMIPIISKKPTRCNKVALLVFLLLDRFRAISPIIRSVDLYYSLWCSAPSFVVLLCGYPGNLLRGPCVWCGGHCPPHHTHGLSWGGYAAVLCEVLNFIHIVRPSPSCCTWEHRYIATARHITLISGREVGNFYS